MLFKRPVENGNCSSIAPVAIEKVPSVAIVASNFLRNLNKLSKFPAVSLSVLMLFAGII